jgi:hypothetical protein
MVTAAQPVPLHELPFVAVTVTATEPEGGVVGALYVAPLRVLLLSDPQLPDGEHERLQVVVLPQPEPESVAVTLSFCPVCSVLVAGVSVTVQPCAFGRNIRNITAKSSFFIFFSDWVISFDH